MCLYSCKLAHFTVTNVQLKLYKPECCSENTFIIEESTELADNGDAALSHLDFVEEPLSVSLSLDRNKLNIFINFQYLILI